MPLCRQFLMNCVGKGLLKPVLKLDLEAFQAVLRGHFSGAAVVLDTTVAGRDDNGFKQ